VARIRSIKPEFWSSEQITECSVNARLMFIGMWNFCDDAGRKVASVKRVKMEVFPGDDFSFSDIRGWMDELIAHGLVTEYESQGQSYWAVTGWKHQKISHPQPSSIPDPFSECSVNAPAPFTPDLIRRELKGIEGNREKEARVVTRFVAPSVEDVREYATTTLLPLDADRFVDFYQSKDWKVGRVKMKDWKAAARNAARDGWCRATASNGKTQADIDLDEAFRLRDEKRKRNGQS
jgi:hypothetical protein